tara:strand:- start:1418 stop:1993 length:576 start_codon:yes stop_codon:yes gene_type:complete
MIEFLSIRQFFSDRVLQLNASLRVNQGDMIHLTGHNGCGKTTLIELMCHIQRGDVSMQIDNRPIAFRDPAYCQRINYISLNDRLPEYVCVGQYLAHCNASMWPLVSELDPKMKIMQLSSGQRQKLRLAKLLDQRPYIFLDEPFNALDASAVDMLSEYFIQLQQQGITLIYASHISGPSTKRVNCEEIISIQ